MQLLSKALQKKLYLFLIGVLHQKSDNDCYLSMDAQNHESWIKIKYLTG